MRAHVLRNPALAIIAAYGMAQCGVGWLASEALAGLAVSGEHALITTIGNDSFLQDLDSTNGTLV